MSQPLIFEKINSVMVEMNSIAKDSENRAQGFKFRGIDDVINELHPRLAKHGIFIVPKVLEERRDERQTKTGGTMTYVILKIEYTLFAKDGSSVVATMIGEASDTGDKASNKAQSVALKYALLQIFAIPTEDSKDPDEDTPEQSKSILGERDSQMSAIAELVSKFRKIGVSGDMICNRYRLKMLNDLNSNHVAELNDIGRQIVQNKQPIATFFKVAT